MTAKIYPGNRRLNWPDAMPRILIIGADDVWGAEFARQYAAEGWTVYVTAAAAGARAELAAMGENVTGLAFDQLLDASLRDLIARIGPAALDIVLFGLGMGRRLLRSAAEVSVDDWTAAVAANTFAPAKLAIALRANLELGPAKKLVALSPLAASIAHHEIDEDYAYRASKAALHAIWRSFSIEWRSLGIACLLLCPEDGQHPAGQSPDPQAVPADVAVMRRTIATAGLDESGHFLTRHGAKLPW
jgi:NAD(P)-dependent dehydrogenase (short-subunit alcohol dehydrogenase family)